MKKNNMIWIFAIIILAAIIYFFFKKQNGMLAYGNGAAGAAGASTSFYEPYSQKEVYISGTGRVTTTNVSFYKRPSQPFISTTTPSTRISVPHGYIPSGSVALYMRGGYTLRPRPLPAPNYIPSGSIAYKMRGDRILRPR